MKTVSSTFKQNIAQMGKQIDTIVTCSNVILSADDVNSIIPTFNTNILKSAMKQIDLDCNIQLSVGTNINVQFGIMIDEVNQIYEYINYGNYIVYDNAYNADTLSYVHTCYDKMLYSMTDYVGLGLEYPTTVDEYINAIAEFLGLTFKNYGTTYVNSDKIIVNELYTDIGFTFRDILDELAQVTASTICINEETDELEVRYIVETNDIINDDYLKDTNIQFGQIYGPINSIVLSRSADADTVYLQDAQSIIDNGLCEIKIRDNQIMNWNDRSDYLPDILNQLGGLTYVLNDFGSSGICYYEMCDRYTIEIEEDFYSCVMFNDEVHIDSGLEENIFTELPEESETDYTKSDTTDIRLNQLYIIADKQRGQIELMSSDINANYENITELIITSDSIQQQVSDTNNNLQNTSDYLQGQIINNTTLINQTSTNIVTTIQQTGGNNRIQNSVGYKDSEFWTLNSDVIVTTSQDSDTEQTTTSGSKFIINSGSTGTSMQQSYLTIVGTDYNISFKYRRTTVNGGTTTITLNRSDQDFDVLVSDTVDSTDWVLVSFPYTATISNPYIIFDCGRDQLEFSDFIVNEGEEQPWSQYFDEVYGKTHTLDSTGLTLKNLNNNNNSRLTDVSLLLSDGINTTAELSAQRVASNRGEFTNECKVGNLRILVIDNNNIIEF